MILVITGGSGSLGKAILDQQELLAKNGITRIRVISRDEAKQAYLEQSYRGDIKLDCFLGDVSDSSRMVFGLKDAHFVIHAAAQKRIEKFQLDIPQGYKTNILGTYNVANGFLNSKNAIGAMFVSTDKAAEPITAYGVSKLASEHVWMWHNTFQKNIFYNICRYGNVFGSRGSVIERWHRQALDREKFEITNENCTRFFIPLHKAAQFVLQSLFSEEKIVHIPKMKSIEMLKLAEMIWYYHNPKPIYGSIPYEVIGMRATEKVHEILEIGGVSSENAEKFTEGEIHEMYKNWMNIL